jgi:hypothetical protein
MWLASSRMICFRGSLFDLADLVASHADPVYPKGAVRVGHDLDHIGPGQRIGDQRPQSVIKALLLTVMNRVCVCRHD